MSKRRVDEPYNQYRKRLKEEDDALKFYLRGYPLGDNELGARRKQYIKKKQERNYKQINHRQFA